MERNTLCFFFFVLRGELLHLFWEIFVKGLTHALKYSARYLLRTHSLKLYLLAVIVSNFQKI